MYTYIQYKYKQTNKQTNTYSHTHTHTHTEIINNSLHTKYTNNKASYYTHIAM